MNLKEATAKYNKALEKEPSVALEGMDNGELNIAELVREANAGNDGARSKVRYLLGSIYWDDERFYSETHSEFRISTDRATGTVLIAVMLGRRIGKSFIKRVEFKDWYNSYCL